MLINVPLVIDPAFYSKALDSCGASVRFQVFTWTIQ